MLPKPHPLKNWYSAGDWVFEDRSTVLTLIVLPEDEEPVDCGLLDAYGNKLYRQSRKERAGFKWSEPGQ